MRKKAARPKMRAKKNRSRPPDLFNEKKTRKVEQIPFFIYVLRGSRLTAILTSVFPEVAGVFSEFSFFDERRNPTAISQIAASSHILLLRKYSTCAPRLPTPNANCEFRVAMAPTPGRGKKNLIAGRPA